MSAKLRLQVGETVISWGLTPEQAVEHENKAPSLPPKRFAVIEGGLGRLPLVQNRGAWQSRSA